MSQLRDDIRLLFSRSDIARFVLIVVLMLGGSLLELASLGVVPLFVALLADGDGMESLGRLADLAKRLNFDISSVSPMTCGLLMGGLFALRTAYLSINYYIQERVMRNRQVAVSSRLFKAYMTAPYMFHLKHNSSIVITNVEEEVERVIQSVLIALLDMMRNGVIILSVVLLMMWYDPLVCLGAFFALGLFGGGFMFFANRKMGQWGWEAHVLRQDAVKSIGEGIGAYTEAQVMGKTEYFCGRLHTILEKFNHRLCQLGVMRKSLWPLTELITVCVLLGAMGVMLMMHDGDTKAIAPTMALIAACMARLKGNLTEFMANATTMRSAQGILATICSDLRELDSYPKQNEDVADIPFEKEIRFDGLSFRYDGAEGETLHDVNLTVAKGMSVGIVGPSGSGKTTLVNMLLGLLPPSDGKIMVDGRDVADCMSAWRRHIGYVAQDIYLLDDTIRANIALGVKDDEIDEQALKQAIVASQLDEFLTTLPEGELTMLGERGVRLSGGQRQRVAIARALYRNPQLLVFDEATSALDTTTERAVVSAIERLRGKHTLVIIAHRLTTVKGCDNLVYLNNGRVEATGSYEELQEKVPAFKAMVSG